VNKIREEDAAIARKLQEEGYSNDSQQRNNKKVDVLFRNMIVDTRVTSNVNRQGKLTTTY